jgi:hypothetical protein
MAEIERNERIFSIKKTAHPSRIGLTLHRAGRNFRISCPFHDDEHQSLEFFDAFGHWRFKCFPCGEHGDLIEFIQRYRFDHLGLTESYNQALDFWDGGSGDPSLYQDDNDPDRPVRSQVDKERALELFARYCHLAAEQSEMAIHYLKSRGWKWEQAFYYGIGFYAGDPEPFYNFCMLEGVDRNQVSALLNYLETWKEPRLTLPARNSKGIIYTVIGRQLTDGDESRYVPFCSYESGVPFNIQANIENPIIVDTMFDALTSDCSGLPGVVSLMGEKLNLGHVLKLKACGAKSLTLVLKKELQHKVKQDQLIATGLELTRQNNMVFKSVLLPKDCDVDSFIRENGIGEFIQLIEQKEPDTVQSRRRNILMTEIKNCFDRNRKREASELVGYALGSFPQLAQALDGIQPGYHLISAPPFAGHTNFLLSLAMDLVDSNPLKLIFITLQMPRSQVFNRMVAYLSGQGVNDVQRKNEDPIINEQIQQSTRELMGLVKSNRVEIWDSSIVKNDETLAKLLREERELNSDVVVCIDAFQYLKLSGHFDGREAHERRSGVILDFYKELEIPLICTGELALTPGGNHQVPPMLKDITESSAYINDPGVIMLLSGENDSSLSILKNRSGQDTLTVPIVVKPGSIVYSEQSS